NRFTGIRTVGQSLPREESRGTVPFSTRCCVCIGNACRCWANVCADHDGSFSVSRLSQDSLAFAVDHCGNLSDCPNDNVRASDVLIQTDNVECWCCAGVDRTTGEREFSSPQSVCRVARWLSACVRCSSSRRTTTTVGSTTRSYYCAAPRGHG